MLVRGIQLAELFQFLNVRHHDPPDRIVGIVPVNQRLIIFIGAESEFFG